MRIDYYTQPHKKQRNALFALATLIGDTDFTDLSSVQTVHHNVISVTSELRDHALSEETFVHPLLTRKLPDRERVLHHEHDELEKYLNDLDSTSHYLQTLAPHYSKCKEQGLEFYRLVNRFIAMYLEHINEEEYIMQNLWEIARHEELLAMITAYKVSLDKETGIEWLNTHFINMSLNEQQLMLKTIQLLAPAAAYKITCQLIEKITSPDKCKLIFNVVSISVNH